MKIVIDSRMRDIEKEYLNQIGELIELKYQSNVYEEISSHPDIFLCKIQDDIIKAPNLKLEQINDLGITGVEIVKEKYPEDIRYNLCNIGNFVIHNFKYTDKRIIELIEDKKLTKIQVEQGYSNCSIAVVSDNACITSDKGIYEALEKNKIDTLYIEENNIKLLNKEGKETKMKGFIGGATAIIDNKFILFGDSKFLKNREQILQFIHKYNLELIEFKGLNIHDYGGIIII